MQINELKAEAVRKGLTIEELAEQSGIARTTMWRRFNGTGSFTVEEIKGISKALGLDGKKILDIFFADKVS